MRVSAVQILRPSRVAIGGVVAIAWSILILAAANAQTQRVERNVVGLGADDAAAVVSALQEATFQICGVRIQSALDVRSIQIEDDDGVRMKDEVNRRIRASTAKPNCEIEGYEVLDSSRDGVSTRATLRVRYTVYKVPGPSMERRRIAVLNFPMEEVHLYGGVDINVDLVKNLEDEFRAKIEALLTQGRRFGVLDRSRPDVYAAEKRLLRSRDVGRGERARLGKVLGTDYLLYGTVDRVVVEDQSEVIEITGERREQLFGFAEVRFTLLATVTRQVKWSSSIAVERTFPVRLRPQEAVATVLSGVAAAMVDELTENIYPPRVTRVLAPGQFILNRGGGTVVGGDLFEVFKVGDRLIDPDTGEPLGRIETSVGIAQIVDVKPKYSLAELVSGNADIARGMVLRRRRVDAAPGAARVEAKPSFQDNDGDGLPDYLNRR